MSLSLLKKITIVSIAFMFSMTFLGSQGLFAQQGNNAVKIGTAQAFAQQLLETKSANRSSLTIQTTESALPLVINVNTAEGIRGGVEGHSASNVFFDFVNNKIEGKVILTDEKKAYNYFTDAAGNLFVEAVDINKVVCVDMYNGPMEPAAEIDTKRTSFAIPELQSLPGEVAVIYLDFDGQVVSGGKWNSGNTIDAKPSGLSDAQIKNAWYVTSEDYRPYKVNVTTIESVYNAAPANRRMRCIITPTNTAAPGSGGVAYIGSFDAGDSDRTPCWVFNLGGDGQTTGETCSHEVGHTVGLNHDGTSDGTTYYKGHNMWAPIMGASYNKAVTQWSKGEYTNANNKEDDVTIIATQNGFTWRADEAGNTVAAAAALKIETDNSTVKAENNYGIILKSTDIDVYSFKTGAGSVTFTVKPAPFFPDLDVLLTITDASGTVLETANSTSTLSATITKTLAAGTYYLQIDGTGSGTAANGYTDYSSVGEYTIEGKVVANVTGITESGKGIAAIYPNPATDQIQINLNNAGIINTIQVVNMLGQSLYAIQTEEPTLNINLSDYKKGIYFIHVSNANGASTAKFVKE
jgi:hypothetical protein